MQRLSHDYLRSPAAEAEVAPAAQKIPKVSTVELQEKLPQSAEMRQIDAIKRTRVLLS